METCGEHKTIEGISKAQINVKRSKFISFCKSVFTEQEAMNFVDKIRSEFSDASHVCYAFSIGEGSKKITKSSDAGEPHNSAGKPILSAIEASSLENVICVVVRYFGGIKLGIGGLIRAYGEAAREALKNAKIVTCVSREDLQVELPYKSLGLLVNIVSRLKGKILRVDHGSKARVLVNIKSGLVKEFIDQIKSIGNDISVKNSQA